MAGAPCQTANLVVAVRDAVILDAVAVVRDGRTVVHRVSASISHGSWFGVVGANGSGKTTLLRALAGRLPFEDGRCLVRGEDRTTDRAGRARVIGFAPPIEHLPGALRIRDLLKLAGGDVDAQQARNANLWDALGIERLMSRRVEECSSGMRQRAAIALAFATDTPIVILDEPFNWIDPVAAFDVRSVLADMVGPRLTLITALHDLTTLCGSCKEGVVMAQGAISLALSTDQLRTGQRDIVAFERQMIAALR